MLKGLVARMIEARGYKLVPDDPNVYTADGLRTVHNHDFVRDPAFVRAYGRGVAAAGEDYDWQWRVHLGLWAAMSAARLDGDFVECGVNRGFLSSAIMELLDWDTLGKTFWLLDTFAGVDETILPPAEREHVQRRPERAGSLYVDGVDLVRRNFAAWTNVRIIVGSVPSTLDQIDADTDCLSPPRHELLDTGSSGTRRPLAATHARRRRVVRRLGLPRIRAAARSHECVCTRSRTSNRLAPDRPGSTAQALALTA